MLLTIRKCVVAAGAFALLSAQAAQAVPAKPAPAVDPLVALSLLGTAQSRAAVCDNAGACGLPVAAAASAQSGSPSVATAASAAAVQDVPGRPESRDLIWVLAIGAGMALIAVLVAALAGNDEDAPVSPE